MNLTEAQSRIMSKSHRLRENKDFNILPIDTKRLVETLRFKNLEEMNQIDLYVLESYIDKADNELSSKSVYDLISEMAAFVHNKLLEVGEDQERLKLEELKTYLTELNEAIRDWEVREMKREAAEEKPVDLDFVKIVDSLSSIVDRLLVQYGGDQVEVRTEQEEEEEEDVKEGCDKDVDDEFEEMCGEDHDKEKEVKEQDDDEDKEKGSKERIDEVVKRTLEDIKDIVKDTIKKKGSEMEKPSAPAPKPEDGKKPEGGGEGDGEKKPFPPKDEKPEGVDKGKEKAVEKDREKEKEAPPEKEEKPENGDEKKDEDKEKEEKKESLREYYKRFTGPVLKEVVVKEGGVKRAYEDAIVKVAKKYKLSRSEEDKLNKIVMGDRKAFDKFAKMKDEVNKMVGA